ncbi:YybS family protein [Pseudobacillus sp. 179-B 2D1 NHS]|uniref:YybS family protein n=1 Tax=Pseudobacillus sp. 179-B 2D1 NHS TaxID=3374292 RepID=UPI00387A278D
MDNKKMITEGVKRAIIFAVLFTLTLYIPGLGMIASLFLLLPFLAYSAKYPARTAISFAAICLIISLLLGGLPAVPFALLFIMTGTIMGNMIQKNRDKFSIFMAGSLIFLLNIVVLYVTIMGVAGDQAVDISASFKQSYEDSAKLMESMGNPLPEAAIEQAQEVFDYLTALMPSLLVLFSLGSILILMAINFPIAKKMGVDVPTFKPFREWHVPKSILWYYIILLVMSLVAVPEKGSMWYFFYINIMFMLQFCLLLQGLSFLYFIAHLKKWPKILPILLTVFSILFLPLLYIVRLLGIIDLGFDLRQRLQRKR